MSAVHLVTAAPTPSTRWRLAVCFGALCAAGTSGGIDEASGLPCEPGTKDRTGVTCPACLAASAGVPVYRVVAEADGDWRIVGEFIDFEPAGNAAKRWRGDGYKARVKQPEAAL